MSVWETVIVVEPPEPPEPPPSDASSPPQATSMVADSSITKHKNLCTLLFIISFNINYTIVIAKKGERIRLDPPPLLMAYHLFRVVLLKDEVTQLNFCAYGSTTEVKNPLHLTGSALLHLQLCELNDVLTLVKFQVSLG